VSQVIERLVKRLENNIPANDIPHLINEIAEKVGEIFGGNYVVETQNLIVADVEYRSWHSRTYCRSADCISEEQLYEKLVEILQRLPKQPLHTTIVPGWRHYCGASPVYHRYNIIILRMPNIYYALITYNGGRCWHAEYRHVSGVGIEHKSEFLTDGCVDWEMFVNPPKPQP